MVFIGVVFVVAVIAVVVILVVVVVLSHSDDNHHGLHPVSNGDVVWAQRVLQERGPVGRGARAPRVRRQLLRRRHAAAHHGLHQGDEGLPHARSMC